MFADEPGTLSMEWAGWQVETSVAVLVLGGVGLVLLILLAWRLVAAVFGAPRVFLRSRRERRRPEGYQALTQGMVAVAAGRAAEARRLARNADALLAAPPLTPLPQAH